MSTKPTNAYLTGSIPRVFVKMALPIIVLTGLNGILTVVDAILLGALAGPEAIAAVTLAFPVSMLLAALATMVSTGMASIVARSLGAGQIADARRTFAGAHGLSIVTCVLLMIAFAAAGRSIIDAAAGASPQIASMAHGFLTISILTAPVLFILSLHSDALRTEGRIGFMAIAGTFVVLMNLAFNYSFIVWFGLGVSGSAIGTALAQILALLLIVLYRVSGHTRLTVSWRELGAWRSSWREILALGAPRSLSFIGISLSAAATIASLGWLGTGHFDQSVAAYGIVTRVMSLLFFPQLGMSLALQALVGNNTGAGLWQRSNDSLKLSLWVSLAYSVLVEIGFIMLRHNIGMLFTSDPVVLAELDRVVPIFVALYVSFGPMMMISSYFQSLGDVRRSAILALSRTYVFALPMIFVLPRLIGENGIWIASPLADLMLLVTTALTLRGLSGSRRWGLFASA